LECDAKELEEITKNYSIFQINEDNEKPYGAEMFLGYDVENFELMARRLSQGNNLEYKRLLEDVAVSEVVKLYAIDSAINHAETKNAEH